MQHLGPVRTVGFSADGESFRTTCADGGVRLWESIVEQPVRLVLEHAGKPVAFATDSKSFIAMKNGVVRFWDTADGRPTGPMIQHPGGARFAALSRDGKTIVTAGGDEMVRLWDAATGRAHQIADAASERDHRLGL